MYLLRVYASQIWPRERSYEKFIVWGEPISASPSPYSVCLSAVIEKGSIFEIADNWVHPTDSPIGFYVKNLVINLVGLRA